jgi:hypothetical protein
VVLTNILTRSAFLREVMDNTALFYEYQVKEGETPEIIAHKLYGSADRHWIVLLFNDMSDAFYEFPLTQDELTVYMEKKYGLDLANNMSTIHHYEERVTRQVLFNNIVQSEEENRYVLSALYQDPDTGAAVIRPSLPSTPDTCVDIGSTTETFANGITVVTSTKYCNVTNYTHEFEENEKKRTIRLLDAKWIGNVESELRRLMK